MGHPSTRPVDETCRRAQVVSLRSSRSGQVEHGERQRADCSGQQAENN